MSKIKNMKIYNYNLVSLDLVSKFNRITLKDLNNILVNDISLDDTVQSVVSRIEYYISDLKERDIFQQMDLFVDSNNIDLLDKYTQEVINSIGNNEEIVLIDYINSMAYLHGKDSGNTVDINGYIVELTSEQSAMLYNNKFGWTRFSINNFGLLKSGVKELITKLGIGNHDIQPNDFLCDNNMERVWGFNVTKDNVYLDVDNNTEGVDFLEIEDGDLVHIINSSPIYKNILKEVYEKIN